MKKIDKIYKLTRLTNKKIRFTYIRNEGEDIIMAPTDFNNKRIV